MIFLHPPLSPPRATLAQFQRAGRSRIPGARWSHPGQVRALEQAMRSSIHEQGLDVEPRIVVLTRLIPEAEGDPATGPGARSWGNPECPILKDPLPGRERGRWCPKLDVPLRRSWPNRTVTPWTPSRTCGQSRGEARHRSSRNLLRQNWWPPSWPRAAWGDPSAPFAHGLEKTKLPSHSDLYWKDMEGRSTTLLPIHGRSSSPWNAADFINQQQPTGDCRHGGQRRTVRELPDLHMPGL